MPLLEVRQVRGGYTEADILQGVDLTVEDREAVVIIGPNGAGKSTLMKAVFGLVPVRGGDILLGGKPITNAKPETLVGHGLSYVPQERNVFPSLTVQENLEMGAFARRDDWSGALARVYEIFPPLADKRHKPAGSLSGGQRQMVAMGRALMQEPRLLMLDEPTAGLSPKYMDEIFERVRGIIGAGIAVLMVEQNARQALAIADRGYVLATGRNRFTDTGPGLLANPQVAEMFLGG
ncbi:MAG TPA: ABC transporter ATP-binding protein [Azospirillaceae bacterium]|nr:ABC transporter ATP-binding protein [Azospirillaceae bacterium]